MLQRGSNWSPHLFLVNILSSDYFVKIFRNLYAIRNKRFSILKIIRSLCRINRFWHVFVIQGINPADSYYTTCRISRTIYSGRMPQILNSKTYSLRCFFFPTISLLVGRVVGISINLQSRISERLRKEHKAFKLFYLQHLVTL